MKELVTDPEQIIAVLSFDRNAGTYTGVHEQKISAAIAVVQAPQEQFVEPGKDGEKAAAQVRRRFVGSPMNAIGGEGLQRAQLLPIGKGAGISKEILHQGLVVAAQAHRVIFDHANSQ